MSRFSYIIGSAIAVVAIAAASAEPTPFPTPIQGHGGNGRGQNVMRAVDDVTLTEITRVELAYAKEVSDLANARAAITRAAFGSPANSPDIQAKVHAIAAAELSLAMKKADAYQQLKSKLKYTTPEKAQQLANAMGAGGGAAGGRGGAAAPAAAAPAMGGAAAPRGQ